MRSRWFILGGLLLSLLLAGVVSNFASDSPDGLEAVSRQGCEASGGRLTGGDCIARTGTGHEVGGPLSGYGIAGIDNPHLSTGLAGVLGVLLVFAVGVGMFRLLHRAPATSQVVEDAGSPTRRKEPGAGPDQEREHVT